MRRWLFGGICFAMAAICGIAFAQQSFYSIHVSSHRQRAEADAEIKALNARGLEAFVRHVEVQDKGKWYRIFIGKYASSKEAADQVERLKGMKVSEYFAVKRLSAESPKSAAPAAAKPAKAPDNAQARSAKSRSMGYYLFVGFFRDLDAAQREVDRLGPKLASHGDRAFITRESVSDGMNYRVYIGTYSDQQQAAAAGAALQEKGLLSAFAIPVPTTQDMVTGRLPAAKPEKSGASVPAAAAAAERPSAKPQRKGASVSDAATTSRKGPSKSRTDDFDRYALMLKAGAFAPQDVDEFSVSTATTRYSVSDDAAAQIGLEGRVRFNEYFGLYGNVDTVFIDGIDVYNVSAGPVINFQAGRSVTPYLKGGAVYGDFSWDAPGEFDSSLGWEVGAGVTILESRGKFGIEFAYRDMSFDYQAPDDPAVIPSGDSIDLSGYSVMATFSYGF